VSGALRWLRRWGISFASLGGGILTLFVFRRGLPHVAWIIGYLLLLWLLYALITQARQARHPLVATALDYTVQTLYHGLLLFVLPAYYAAATLTSVNVIFVVVLAALALLATFDPWYKALVHPRPWIGALFFIVSIFAALNVALPLLGVRPYVALLLSAWTAVVAATPAVRRTLGWPWAASALTTALLGVLATVGAGVGCIAIPPAPLFVARARLSWTVGTIESLEPMKHAIRADELRQNGLTAYTAIYAPAGLRQPVAHVWKQNGRVQDIVTFTAIAGGRREGYRTWSRKTSFPDSPLGRWTVDVMTTSGQLIGRLTFRVVA
jgi:Family of unknown function (DUF5924)/Protein of unknown function (DUF2914)